MSSKPPKKPERRRHLSKEDEALWAYTAATLKPLPVRKGRHVPGAENLDIVPPFEQKNGAAPPAKKPPGVSSSAREPAVAKAKSASAPDLSTFDRKAARRLRQGRFDIEARIDLHGMRQHEAHTALRRFLQNSFRLGRRWVLVITGKGATRRPRDEDEMAFGMPERGVLKRNVPMWLAEADMRAIVVSYTSASISHGGEGALYVQLRNPDRVRT